MSAELSQPPLGPEDKTIELDREKLEEIWKSVFPEGITYVDGAASHTIPPESEAERTQELPTLDMLGGIVAHKESRTPLRVNASNAIARVGAAIHRSVPWYTLEKVKRIAHEGNLTPPLPTRRQAYLAVGATALGVVSIMGIEYVSSDHEHRAQTPPVVSSPAPAPTEGLLTPAPAMSPTATPTPPSPTQVPSGLNEGVPIQIQPPVATKNPGNAPRQPRATPQEHSQPQQNTRQTTPPRNTPDQPIPTPTTNVPNRPVTPSATSSNGEVTPKPEQPSKTPAPNATVTTSPTEITERPSATTKPTPTSETPTITPTGKATKVEPTTKVSSARSSLQPPTEERTTISSKPPQNPSDSITRAGTNRPQTSLSATNPETTSRATDN